MGLHEGVGAIHMPVTTQTLFPGAGFAIDVGNLRHFVVWTNPISSRYLSLLPDASPRSLTVASLLGAASSSCSYAAVAMARSIVRKGGDFTCAMAFQFAATNLVLELGVLLWLLISWQFAAAEFIGGPIMIAVLVVLFRFFLKDSLRQAAIGQAGKGVTGRMQAHAAMSMAQQPMTWTQRLSSKEGWTVISHSYVTNWTMLWRDVGVGMLVAGALGAGVPISFNYTAILNIIFGAVFIMLTEPRRHDTAAPCISTEPGAPARAAGSAGPLARMA
ncbi:permease [Paraburkholderia sp. SIMBA_030]|uniref:permease n=1 Tax=Paraburkholderia sp. SIMBA_030 TaxID=3085773 RepID=UPI00397B16B1